MKSHFLIIAAIAAIIALQSCGKYRDGRLLADNLTTSSGKLNFAPMQRSDSFSVISFKPDTLYYNGKPYTGAIGEYNASDTLVMTGFATNGLKDSIWKFYYGSGVLRMEGKYRNGIDVGFWRSYYTRNKPKVDKFYDDAGYLLLRVDYYDNGKLKYYENISSPLFNDTERHFGITQRDSTSLYYQDGVVMIKTGNQVQTLSKKLF